MSYRIILSQTTFEKIIAYRDQLAAGTKTPGKRLAAVLNDLGTSISDITAEEFIEALLNSKKPQIYAEHYSFDDGRWNKDEFSLLGDISVSVPVTVFD